MQELRKKKETEEKLEIERIEREREMKRIKRERRMTKKNHFRTKSTPKDYYGYVSVEKPHLRKEIEKINEEREEEYRNLNMDKTRNGRLYFAIFTHFNEHIQL